MRGKVEFKNKLSNCVNILHFNVQGFLNNHLELQLFFGKSGKIC